MVDIEKLLSSTGLKVKEGGYKIPPKLPYLVYMDDIQAGGADYLNCIADRSITIYLYCDSPDREACRKIEAVLNEYDFHFSRSITYITSEKFWQITFHFEFTEKI